MIRIIDFETTGLEDDAVPCEIGWVDVLPPLNMMSDPESLLCNPGKEIGVEAMAVHHITNEMAEGAPSWSIAKDILKRPGTLLEREPEILCAHNARYEQQFWNPPGSRWICTYKCALRIWPDAPSHKNQVLRYWRDYPCDPAKASPPHRAGPDCYVTGFILLDLLQNASTEQMIEWSAEPALLPRVTFGKHYGEAWTDVPVSYLEWILRQDFDEDVLHTARHHLNADQMEAPL